MNIVNRGREPGVQLELARGLRDALASDPLKLARFAEAVRSGLTPQRIGPHP